MLQFFKHGYVMYTLLLEELREQNRQIFTLGWRNLHATLHYYTNDLSSFLFVLSNFELRTNIKDLVPDPMARGSGEL